jgi:hypothetical protein
MVLTTVLALGAWIFVMGNTDPREAVPMDFVLFYLTMTISSIGLLSLAGTLLRVKILGHKDVISREVKTAFRHAILLSIIGVLSLFFMTQNIFHWWVLLLLIAATSLIEFVSLKVQLAGRG